MDFYIRIRFKTSERRPLEINEEEIEIPHIGNDRLFLKTKESGRSILKSSELVLEGKTYESNKEGLKFGEKYKDALSFTFAYLGAPADFGDRTPKYTTSDLWLKIIAESSGYSTIPDILGLSIQPSETNLEISVPFPTVRNSINKDRFLNVFAKSINLDLNFDASKKIAFELFSASTTNSYIDAKFLLLMMALETLIGIKPRSEKSKTHVDHLIKITNESKDLSVTEKCSLCSSLKWLSNESISHSGRELAHKLDAKQYLNQNPPKFFNYCYDLRSKLVHGYIPRPDYIYIRNVISPLETFVSDLICHPHLDIEST